MKFRRALGVCLFVVGCGGGAPGDDASATRDASGSDSMSVPDARAQDDARVAMDSGTDDASGPAPDAEGLDAEGIDAEGIDAADGGSSDDAAPDVAPDATPDASARCRSMPAGNPFYPQYPLPGTAGHPRRYQPRGETLIDCVTGLEWQRNPPNVDLSVYAGAEYCERLVLAGFDDWVLPTRLQFVTLFDRSVPDPGPAIDTTAFPGAASGLYLTAVSPVLIDFQLSFSAGAVIVFDGNRSVSARVRCVRQTPAGSDSRLTDVGDGTVRDDATGLVWQRSTSANRLRLADARAYCATPAMHGLPGAGWRLPEILELESIADDLRRGGPRLAPAFLAPSDPGLWSVGSATVRGGTTAVYELRYDGATYASGDGPFYVRCVR